MNQEAQPTWHQIIQDLFDENLSLLSGKHILKREREKTKNVHFDYFVTVGEPDPEAAKTSPILPLSHLKRYSLIEFKSMHESLSEGVFRNYMGRALIAENPHPKVSLMGELALTIVTARKPVKLLANKKYGWRELEPWKYRYECAGLEIYVVVLSQMRDVKGGLAMALLQVLESDERHQQHVWRSIIDQDLPKRELVQRIMKKIDKEGLMGSIAEDWKQEGLEEGLQKGREEGREEGQELKVRTMLQRYLNDHPGLKKKYERVVDQTTGGKALEDLFFTIIGQSSGTA